MKNKYFFHPTAFAVSATAGIVYVLCALLLGLFPSSLQLFAYLFHGIDIQQIAVSNFTAVAFFVGLIETILLFYIIGVIFVLIHKKCEEHCKRNKWI